MNVNQKDRMIVRDLARQVAKIAALPAQQERTQLWKALNRLQPERPVVVAFNEDVGGHTLPLPVAKLLCEDPLLRSWEENLRLRIFSFENIHDDHPVTNSFNVGWVIMLGDRGLEPIKVVDEATEFTYREPCLKERADLQKLHFRTVEIDRERTALHVQMAQQIVGDILHVRPTYGPGWRDEVGAYAIQGGISGNAVCDDLMTLRGGTQVMYDMYDNPAFLHELASFLRDDKMHELDTLEREGVLTLNNNPDDYIGSGTLGATDELPSEDYQGVVHFQDLWGFAESQSFAAVGPEQWFEFVLQYQLPILNRFGPACYGCCEPLDQKYDLLFEHIPRLRRVSVTSPYADLHMAAEKLAGRCILSWKPFPPWLVDPVDWDSIERATRDTVRTAKEHGCCLEIVMKGFRTPYRNLARWADVTSHVVEDMA